MRDLRALFQRNIAVVADDDRRASDALVKRLKRLTPEQFLRESPKTFDKLSLTQYREIVAGIAPEVEIVEPAAEPHEGPGSVERLKEFWRTRSAMARSFCSTMVMSALLTISIVALGPTVVYKLAPFTLRRPTDATMWPLCTRLDWDTDGCVYQPRSDSVWRKVSLQTRIDMAMLRYFNPHLPENYIPKGSTLIIWRGRGQLVRTEQ